MLTAAVTAGLVLFYVVSLLLIDWSRIQGVAQMLYKIFS